MCENLLQIRFYRCFRYNIMSIFLEMMRIKDDILFETLILTIFRYETIFYQLIILYFLIIGSTDVIEYWDFLKVSSRPVP